MSARQHPRRLAAAGTLVALCSVAWLDPHATVREANRLYDQGKYDEAANKYNQALVDEPGSSLLHFNLGTTAYKQGKFTDAANDFEKATPAADDPTRTARIAYNLGNTKYRLAEAAETSDPKAALGLYAEALVAYRRAMGAAPGDEDAKFNHELAEKRMHDLEKKLEEQKKEQEQQAQQKQDQQEDQEQKKDQQEQQQEDQQQQKRQEQQDKEQAGQDQKPQQEEADQKQQPQEAGEQPAEPPKEAQQQAQPESAQPQPAEQPGQQRAAAEQASAGESKGEELSRQEATALLDSQRDQEVRPEEIVRQLQGAVAEPARDW